MEHTQLLASSVRWQIYEGKPDVGRKNLSKLAVANKEFTQRGNDLYEGMRCDKGMVCECNGSVLHLVENTKRLQVHETIASEQATLSTIQR